MRHSALTRKFTPVPKGAWKEMTISERGEALKALANSASSTFLSAADCSGVYQTPRVAQMLPHNWTYSSMQGGNGRAP